MGDFNLPHINWVCQSPRPRCRSSQLLIDTTNILHLRQLSSVVNERGVLLDLIFCSTAEAEVSDAIDPILPIEGAHPALDLCLEVGRRYVRENPVFVRDFGRCDLEGVYNSLKCLLGAVYFIPPDINALFTWFMDVLNVVTLVHTPLKIINHTRFPSWFTRELRILVIKKKELHKSYKSSLANSDYIKFSEARSQCKALTNRCYNNYIKHVNSVVASNPKSFWSFVQNLRNTKHPCEALTYTFNDVTAESPPDICNLFATFFSSVYRAKNQRLGVDNQHNYNTQLNLSSCTFRIADVERKLATLNVHKGTGPDDIPASILKYCAALIAPQLTVLLNRSLSQGVFPAALKKSYVIPIHKSASINDITNYRPIVIQPVLAKVFESLLIDYLRFSLKGLSIPEQHGFLPGRSSLTNLALLQHDILSSFDSRHQLDCVYMDFAKAFDTVSHAHLLAKLEGYGITGSLLEWFGSYLTDRTLAVKFKGATSRSFVATSGVPQGSHLGPLLFSLFIGDIVDVVGSNCLLFADDLKIYQEIGSLQDCLRLQRCLVRVEDWCAKNCMNLNAKKCVVISFHRSKQPITFDYVLGSMQLLRKDHIRDLGVVLSDDLGFREHINCVCAGAAKMLGFVVRSSRCGLDIQALLSLYKSYVRSKLEYCSVIWSPYQQYQIDRLEGLQMRFVRLIGLKLGYGYDDSPIHELRNMLGLETLASRRCLFDSVFLFKILNGYIDCSALLSLIDLHVPMSRAMRQNRLFDRRHCRTNYDFYSPIPRLHRLGNRLSEHVDFFNCSVNKLRKATISLVE